MEPRIEAFFHEPSCTVSYVVSDPDGACAIIDPVLDYDASAACTSTTAADALIEHVRARELQVEWILETHAHADHLSAAPYLESRIGGLIGIGTHITEVQALFKELFNAEETFATDGSQFDHLFADGEQFRIGKLHGRVMHTPGHTPACVTYLIEDAAFVGDTLFMPDYGTARADFPGGDATTLFSSIQKLYGLPRDTRLFMCHDYRPGGREPRWETTVAEQRASNIHIHEGVTKQEFVEMRTARDKTLGMPDLILPAVQVNMRAGHFPPPERNGISYLKLPLNKLC